MSDWSMYEIEDGVWDVFGASSDHIVPRPNADPVNEAKAQPDSNKKAKHDLRNNDDECANKADPEECNIFRDSEELGFGSSFEVYQSNVCYFSNELSSSDADIGFIKDGNMESKNIDILDYEWPEFVDFEDVDRMFRHGYSTFGQGSGGPANELSWFSSSSYTIDDSEDTLKSSLQSSCSELNGLKTCSKRPETNMTSWPEKVSAADDYETSCLGYDSYGQWLDAETQNDIVSEKMPNDFRIDGSGVSSIINGTNPIHMNTCQVSNIVNSETDMSRASQSEGIEVNQNSGYFSGSYKSSGQSACYDNLNNSLETSTPESYTVGTVGDSHRFLGIYSSNHLSLHGLNMEVMHNESSQNLMQLKPGKQLLEIKLPNSNKFSAQTLSKSENLVEKINDKGTDPLPLSIKPKLQQRDDQHNANSKISMNFAEWRAGEKVSTKSNTAQNELEKLESCTESDNEVGVRNATIAFSTPETNNTSMQGSSSTTSSGSILSGSSSLQKLQEVMSQLDLKTKLCIRDGLYRLARNAEKRHNPDIVRYGCKEEMISSNIMVANNSKRFIYEETGTNPIDRSIAHLLFYKASGHCIGSADDAMSA